MLGTELGQGLHKGEMLLPGLVARALNSWEAVWTHEVCRVVVVAKFIVMLGNELDTMVLRC